LAEANKNIYEFLINSQKVGQTQLQKKKKKKKKKKKNNVEA
jgi:hypothetical protein